MSLTEKKFIFQFLVSFRRVFVRPNEPFTFRFPVIKLVVAIAKCQRGAINSLLLSFV